MSVWNLTDHKIWICFSDTEIWRNAKGCDQRLCTEVIQNVQIKPFRESSFCCCLQLLCTVNLQQLILTFSPQQFVSHLRKNIHLRVVTQLGDISGQGVVERRVIFPGYSQFNLQNCPSFRECTYLSSPSLSSPAQSSYL